MPIIDGLDVQFAADPLAGGLRDDLMGQAEGSSTGGRADALNAKDNFAFDRTLPLDRCARVLDLRHKR